MKGDCHGVKCAFRTAGTCSYMQYTGNKRGCPPGKLCIHRTLKIPAELQKSIEDDWGVLAIPSEATLRKLA